ncbi:hypothetical protein AAON49_13255 [Pseudotenacibaculum sp. MALMAid0570]|uniref:hypothetical protein n=1 Tax=Pseudotenacibaculum sp. MALMAid0570 TaxID=3143938 RepID=UPI0032DE9C94
MKPLKVLCAIGIVSLFFSCSYQEDTAAFFIDNTIQGSMVLERSPEDPSNQVANNLLLDLTSSESYEKYILRLTELKINKFICNFSNYQGEIDNGQIYIDDILLGSFESNMEHVSIEDPETLSRIAELFLEKTTLDFSFVGESDTFHFLSVSVQVEMKGTFVY